MKKVNLFFVILFSVLAFAACEKDPKPEPPEEKAFQNQEFTVNGINFKMIAVEHGFFIKGERTTSSPNQPVQLTNDYYIGETEVTQALWVAVMGENPSHFQDNLQNPADNISWYDCQRFLEKLNQLTGKEFRFPTEAEWEYAARGGQLNEPYTYSGSDNAGDVAWYKDNSEGKTHPVAQLKPNGLGLYDMTGNVHEWCADAFPENPRPNDTLVNPVSKGDTTYHAVRGGSFEKTAKIITVSDMFIEKTKVKANGQGLRLAMSR